MCVKVSTLEITACTCNLRNGQVVSLGMYIMLIVAWIIVLAGTLQQLINSEALYIAHYKYLWP